MNSQPAPSQGKRLRLPLALFAAAVLAIQIGWLIGTPAYGQMDEIDHAYRAASIAEGHWTDHEPPTPDARGYPIRVPLVMVSAAHDACAHLKYMKPGNCSPLSPPDRNGDVLVSSAAANYNPVYYAVVGFPAVTLAPHSGVGMLIIIRLITALWCDLLIAAAFLVTVRVARSIWPILGVMITAMPVLLCASTAGAPNGVQMAGGLLMWAAMCGLIFGCDPAARGRLLGFWALGSCCVLVTHSTGPMWFGISFLMGLALLGKTRIRALWRENKASVVTSVGITAIIGILAALWTVSQHTNIPSTLTGTATPGAADYIGQPLVWLLQCISAVPFRNNYAPTFVYALGLLLIGGFVVTALRQGDRAIRWAMGSIVVITLTISLTLNFLAYSTQGNAWQGRYTLALAYGLPLLSAWIVGTRTATSGSKRYSDRFLATTIGASIGLINAGSLIRAWSKADSSWPAHEGFSPPPTWLVIGLACVAVLLMMVATERLAQRVSFNAPDERVLV